jgi:hypothetical protein
MDASPLHVWAIIRLLPNMQHVVMRRFRRRGDAESYLNILRRYLHDANLTIVFDPPSNDTNPDAHSKNWEKSGTSSSLSRIASSD